MKILAIDPGFDRIGFAVIEKKDKLELLFSECLVTDRSKEFSERLSDVITNTEKLIKKYKPSEVILEKIFFVKNKKTAMQVAEVRGALMYIISKNNLICKEYTPLQIKTTVTNNGRATKSDMKKMIPHLIKVDIREDMLDDEIDAIAIGLTHLAYKRYV